MYISKFYAHNYRSLKNVEVSFKNGVNVIVGKNNSGKSNIVKGLDILLGDRFPNYITFTDNDFYTEEHVRECYDSDGKIVLNGNDVVFEPYESIEQSFYLEATLEGRDFDENKIRTIKKKTALSKIKSFNSLFKDDNGNVKIDYEFFQNLDEIDNSNNIEEIIQYGRNTKTKWCSAEELLQFLKNSTIIKLFFTKNKDEDQSGYGMLMCDLNGDYWITHFISKKLRDSLLTTALIGTFRSPKDELRNVHYSWFGKLIKGLWDQGKDKVDDSVGERIELLIQKKTVDIKKLVDGVFDDNTLDLREILMRAISHKKVSFKLLDDSSFDLYKNIRLFVNDGIDRPLTEKGSGIQSAIIISLFSEFCKQFHNNSSLLIAEEPELFLHPQARRVIAAELSKFLNTGEAQKRQLIINTHSTEFLKNISPDCIIRIYKPEDSNYSLVYQLCEDVSGAIGNDLVRLLWSNNCEIFFADKVVLVEGGELYLLSPIVDKLTGDNQLLDYNNVSVIRVNGKGNFITYIKMLNEFKIKWLVLGDLDCYKDEVGKIVRHLQIQDIDGDVALVQNAIKNIETDYSKIQERNKKIVKNTDAQQLKRVFELFVHGEIERDNEDLIQIIQEMQDKYKLKDYYSAIQESGLSENFSKVQKALKKCNVFVWSKGELENYYTDASRAVKGSKDIVALEISYALKETDNSVDDFFNEVDELKELVVSIFSDIKLNNDEIAKVISTYGVVEEETQPSEE
ncbi:ATP-dependent nuclease [Rufibacter ruber]|uniref:ATP-dependent nuclease n=1 Tax=Rufibacter ruber TaxID=1783499 RepID=UPI0008377FBB|nr:AAA family ATPase [Rufibacter ruber]